MGRVLRWCLAAWLTVIPAAGFAGDAVFASSASGPVSAGPPGKHAEAAPVPPLRPPIARC